MFTTFRGGQSGAWRVTRPRPVKGDGAGTDAGAVGRPFAVDRAADPALAAPPGGWPASPAMSRYVERAEKEQLVAVQAALGRPEATSRGADPDQEIRGVVGTDAGRAAADFRGQVAPHREQPEISAGDRSPALSLPRSRRALRFPDLVRIRARDADAVRGTGRHAARHRGMDAMSSARWMCGWSAKGWMRGRRYCSRNFPEAMCGRPVTGQL